MFFRPRLFQLREKKMNKNNQTSSNSRVLNFFEKIPVIGRAIIFARVIYAGTKTAFEYVAGESPDPRVPSVVYFGALCFGIMATFVSGMIEYKVMVDAYSSAPTIVSVPLEVGKFFWNLIIGERITVTDATQQNTHKQSLLPLLTVFGLEGSKCIVIIYRHSVIERSLVSGLLRFFLVGISVICSLIFFAQLMNKPHEDDVNTLIETAKTTIDTATETKIANDIKTDENLSTLRSRRDELYRQMDNLSAEVLEEVKTGGNGRSSGYGPVADGIGKAREGINEQLKQVNEEIKTKETEIRNKAKTEAKTEKNEKEASIKKGGRALDPLWMSALLSALHEFFGGTGDYSRRWAVVFFGCFSIMISFALELIINEMFKRIGKGLSVYPISVESN